MDIQELNIQADRFAQKIKHYIITTSGRSVEHATIEDFYQALVMILREEIMINLTATLETYKQKRPRLLYFFSMEYLPGRQLCNNITNMGAKDLVMAVLQKLDRNYSELVSCEPDPGLGHGGLGRLSSCFLDSLATLHYPAHGYGLRYQYGIFEQEIWNGKQMERPDCWLLNIDPWETRNDPYAVNIHFGGRLIQGKNQHGDDVFLLEDYEEVRALPFDTPIIGYAPTSEFSVSWLRLWTTKESPRNFRMQRYNAGFLDQATENTALTDVLYPNDQSELGKRVRLKQEFLLVSASLQDIIRRHRLIYGDLTDFPDKVRIQINDTHPALIVVELIRTLTKNYGFSWNQAVEATKTCCSYTNHTILREALEEWNEDRVHRLLPRQYLIIQKLNQEFCDSVRLRFPDEEDRVQRMSIIHNGQIRMAHLAIVGSHQINGVAQLHTEILKTEVFRDFFEYTPEKFLNITNGVTPRRWLFSCNSLLASFITQLIGSDWIHDYSQLKQLAQHASNPEVQKNFLEIKKMNKRALIRFLSQENPVRDDKGKIVGHSAVLDDTALCSVQIKRIHEYKRQLMNALHLIMLYQELKATPTSRSPRMVVMGGKTAPGYTQAKKIIRLVCCLARKVQRERIPHLAIAFVENYDVSKAELMIPAADLSEQISTAGWEASGTGNMKLSLNGALTIGTEDGANIELHRMIGSKWWPFSFGGSASENGSLQNYRGSDIYDADAQIRQAVDTLTDRTFADTEEEHNIFCSLRTDLLEHDTYLVLRDLRGYYEVQKKAEALYNTPLLWAEMAIHNIAGAGHFSSDRSIHEYASHIWGLERMPPDRELLERVRKEYFEHDRCHIIAK
jgi:glycogen phosphorylase